jgi:hypothetical protein
MSYTTNPDRPYVLVLNFADGVEQVFDFKTEAQRDAFATAMALAHSMPNDPPDRTGTDADHDEVRGGAGGLPSAVPGEHTRRVPDV